MASQIKHYIDGKLVAGRSGRAAPVFNPATGEQTGEVGLATPAEVNAAVAAARPARRRPKAGPIRRRCAGLEFSTGFCGSSKKVSMRLAAVITSEHGKTLSDAKGEIQRGPEVVEFAVRRTAAAEGRSHRERRDTR